MKDTIISKAYAKSILDLGESQKVDVVAELTKLTEAINSSNHLENAMFLYIFTAEEKRNVFTAVAAKLQLAKVVTVFVEFLIQENRIGLLPMIYKDVMVIDDDRRGFLRGTIEGSEDSIEPSVLEQIKDKLKTNLGKTMELNYQKNETITAGFKITAGDIQLDATLDHQLSQFKTDILS